MKKIIIIGGGIAGLSAGIYAQKCGFDVTILESHNLSGGNCTSWRRKGYLFEGGMHWLTGSGENEAIYKMWRYVGALDDSVKIHYTEPFAEYSHKGTPLRFYRDVDATEKHMLSLAPEDEKEIRKLCNNIRKVKNLSMPVSNLRGVKGCKRTRPSISSLFSLLPIIGLMRTCSKISRDEYINKFSHEGLRNLLRSCSNDESGILPIFFTMGTLARGDGGFPEGGSLPFSKRITDTFTALGGKIQYNTRAERVVVERGKVVGVIAGGDYMPSDAVVVTADTMAIDYLFDAPLIADWLDEMRKTTLPIMNTLVSLGIDADLGDYPKLAIFKPAKPITLSTQTYEYLNVNNYANDPVYSPKGKSALTISLVGDTYDFWKSAKEENRYDEEKRRLAEAINEALVALIPETAGHIEVCDIATPLTYERYCGNWRGSWMTELGRGMKMKNYPAVIKGLSGVYFAGQRMTPPGGLPVALMSGRTAVQYLCRDTDTVFVGED